MGLFGKKKDKSGNGGKYSLASFTPGEKAALNNLLDLVMQAPIQQGLKGSALENARCTGNYTYGQLQQVKKNVEKDSLSMEDVKAVSFVLTSGSFATEQLVQKLQKEKVGGERLARAMILTANAKTAKKKAEEMLKKQDSSWESF